MTRTRNLSDLLDSSGDVKSDALDNATSTLDGATDTNITSVADNDLLAYDSTSGKWINQSASEAGISSNVADDTTPQLGGVLDTNGNNIEFPDSSGAEVNRLKFGTGDDMEIMHSGSNSHITHSGTGALYIDANSGTYFRNAAGTEAYASFLQDGTVDLYHNGSKKLNTTSSGAVVYGWLDANEGIRHNNDTNTALTFDNDDIRLSTGGSVRAVFDNDGVTLGDTGNGKIKPVSGTYGSIEIDGGAHSGWEGYSIGGRVVFMHNDSNTVGLYNDVNNQWLMSAALNGEAHMYHAGTSKAYAGSFGWGVNGAVWGYSEGSNNLRVNLTQGSSKNWVAVNQQSSHSIYDSFNTSSVADDGVGDTLVYINNDMNNSNFIMVAQDNLEAGTGNMPKAHSWAAGSYKCQVTDSFADDRARLAMAVHGDLA